jgi:methylglutaconyl-CoA hydratase
MKKALWEGTDHWKPLLPQRAALTGNLALSKITQETLRKFKDKS